VRCGGNWKRDYGESYTGTQGETPDTAKEPPTDYRASSRPYVCPDKADMFSESQSHRRKKSGTFVAWVASGEETKRMKPTDQAILGMVSESPGRNGSEPSGGLDKKN
jgi:hypothetical protein